MAYVVTFPCFGCKHQQCATQCPTESFHEGEQMLYIDPDSCIDCDLCATLCPTQAIFRDDDVPPEWQEFIQLNAEMAKTCPPALSTG